MNAASVSVLKFGLACLLAFVHAFGLAQNRVDISGVGSNQIPIGIAPFAGKSGAGQPIDQIIFDNLSRTGLFKLSRISGNPVGQAGLDVALTGGVEASGSGYRISYQLVDAARGQELLGRTHVAYPADWRYVAHRISDEIYQQLTGEKGAFASRLAYVSHNPRSVNQRYSLFVADSDGHNPQLAVSSPNSIMSPSWAPDAQHLAYVSFESQKSVVYVHDLRTGIRRAVANHRGNNSAPAWSPNGWQLAVTLSRDAVAQIYNMNSSGGQMQRLSNSAAIETEANYSGDGRQIYFVSDRGGNPQIYVMASNGGQAQRVTFNGAYNVSPNVSPTGQHIAYINGDQGFNVQVQDLKTGEVRRLSNMGEDERPSFSPNGRMIVFSSQKGRRDGLYSVSVDGRVMMSLPTAHDARDVAWSGLY